MRALLLAVLAVSACGDDASTMCLAADELFACPLGSCPAYFTAQPSAICPTDAPGRRVRYYVGCRGFEAIALGSEDTTFFVVYRSSDAKLIGLAIYDALAADTTTCSPTTTAFEFDASWCTSSWDSSCTGSVP